MAERLQQMFGQGDFMPHGMCYLWRSELIWLHLVSDSLITLAYFAIPPTLLVLVIKARRLAPSVTARATRGLPYEWIFVAFGVFIIACGLTHAFGVWTIWHPVYWWSGGMKAVTALASIGTAIALPPLVPRALALMRDARDSEARRIGLEQANADLKIAHDRIKELDELKTRFFANVSHELRTPLALMVGPTEKLLSAPDLPEEVRSELETVHRNTRLLRRHVDDLLDVAAAEADQMQMRHARVDLAELTRRIASHFESASADRGDRFSVEAPDAVLAEVDPDKVERILLNLLSNAFKFTPPGGNVSVRLRVREPGVALEPGVDSDAADRGAGDGTAVIEVSDSGPGVPAELRDAIFERFRQVEGGPTRPFGGTGLGLAIAKEFTDLHGGRISVHSSAEGGALFRVELPLRAPSGAEVETVRKAAATGSDEVAAQAVEELRVAGAAPAASTVEAEDSSHGAGAARVLIVEDNLDMGRFVAATLRPACRTLVVQRAATALDELAEYRPDLIITDIMMPVMSGDEFVRELRSRSEYDDVPVLMLTAKADEELRARMLREGAQDYLTKPFSAEELRARAGNWIEVSRARKVMQRELSSRELRMDELATNLAERRRETELALEEARAARDEAERSNRAKSDFLGVMSHELRTPLNAVFGYADLLEMEVDGQLTDGQKRNVERLKASAGHLLALIEEVLTFTKLEAGRERVRIERVDVAELVREIAQVVEPAAAKKGIELLVKLPDEPLRAETDPQRFRQILSNLLSNAIKFTESGLVEVSVAEEAEGGLSLRVTDSGIGIAADQLDRVFEPFWQAEAGTTRQAGGTGLGLSVTMRLTRLLGGDVTVDSRLGEGTTFMVRLPGRAGKSREF